jgi:hypothetical protein
MNGEARPIRPHACRLAYMDRFATEGKTQPVIVAFINVRRKNDGVLFNLS